MDADRRPDPGHVTATLTSLGGFFSWGASPGDDLVPLRMALAAPALPQRFAAMREGLATSAGLDIEAVDERIAVSAVQVGLVSRMWSVALASATLHGWVPDLSTEVLACGQGHRNPVPFATAGAGEQEVDGVAVEGRAAGSAGAAAEAIADLVLAASIGDITTACADLGRTSRQVLVSNTASALVGAGRMLSTHRPEVAALTDATVLALLTHPALSPGGGWVGGVFTRRGCCLYYRLPGHGLCPDCVLVRPGDPAAHH